MLTLAEPPLSVRGWTPIEPVYYNPPYFQIINGVKCSTGANAIPFKIQNLSEWIDYVQGIRTQEQLREGWVRLRRGCEGMCTFHCFLYRSQDYELAEYALRWKQKRMKSDVELNFKEK